MTEREDIDRVLAELDEDFEAPKTMNVFQSGALLIGITIVIMYTAYCFWQELAR